MTDEMPPGGVDGVYALETVPDELKGGAVAIGNFDGQPQLTEMDALIAYMQMLGTLVDFSTFVPDPSR